MALTLAKKNRRQELLLLSGALLVLALALFSPFLVKGELFLYSDANSDTFQSYLPLYQLVVNMLQNRHLSVYSMALGMGGSLLSAQMVILDPFATPVYMAGLLFGLEAMASALLFAQVLRIVCAGLACRFFLGSFQFSPLARCLASVAYAFSAYMAGGIGQHYFFATAPVLLALALAFLERGTKKPTYLAGFILTVAIMGVWSVYFAYMSLLGCGAFALLRYLQDGIIKPAAALRTFLPLLGAVLCGLALAGVVLLPAASLLLSVSNRVGAGDGLLPTLLASLRVLDFELVQGYFLRLFSNQLQGTSEQWAGPATSFNTAHLFCSVLAPLALPQYAVHWLVVKDVPRRKRVVTLAALGITTLLACTVLAGVVFNFFSGYTSRYCFVLLPGLAFLVAWLCQQALVLRRFYTISGWCTAGLCVLTIALGCAWGVPAAAASGGLAIAALLLATLCLQLMASENRSSLLHRFALGGLAVVLGCQLVDDGLSLQAGRGIISRQVYADNVYRDKSTHAISTSFDAKGAAFWRMERAYLGYSAVPAYSYADVEYYRGLSFYNSVVNANLVAFEEEILQTGNPGQTTGVYAFGQIGTPFDKTTADILGLRYVASGYKTGNDAWQAVNGLAENGNTIYENTELSSAGVLYSTWCDEAAFARKTDAQRQALLAHTALVEEGRPAAVPQSDEVPMEALSHTALSGWQGEASSLSLHEEDAAVVLEADPTAFAADRQVFFTATATARQDAVFTMKIDTGFGAPAGSWLRKELTLPAGQAQMLTIKLPVDTVALHLSGTGGDIQLEEAGLRVSEGRAYSLSATHTENPGMGGLVTAEVDAEQNGILVVPVCYEAGWSVTVDGEAAPLLRAQRAFLAVELPAGHSSVVFSYDPPGLFAGAILSLAGLAGLLAFCILLAWRAAANRKRENQT